MKKHPCVPFDLCQFILSCSLIGGILFTITDKMALKIWHIEQVRVLVALCRSNIAVARVLVLQHAATGKRRITLIILPVR